jgi:integrase
MRALAGWHIADVVKKYAAAAGLDVRKFSGHSLRAGFVTESLSGDVPETQIIKVTGHNTTAMLPTYYREKDPFAAAGGGKVWGKKPTKPGGGTE